MIKIFARNKLWVLIGCFLFCVGLYEVYGQQVSWAYQYSVNHESVVDLFRASALLELNAGGYVAAYGGSIMKLDALGNVVWQKGRLGEDCRCYTTAIVQNPDEGFTYSSVFSLPGLSWIIVTRTDAQGNLKWSRIYRRDALNTVGPLIRVREGGYLIVGHTSGRLSPGMWLVRIDENGNIKWQKSYNVIDPSSAQQLGNGDFLIGTVFLSALRIGPGGEVRWQRKYSLQGTNLSDGRVRALPDGGYLLSARFATHNSLIVKVSPSGSVVYSNSYRNQESYALVSTSDGGCIFVGLRYFSNAPFKAAITKLSESGGVSWHKVVRSRVSSLTIGILQTIDRGYLFNPATNWILKLDAGGNIANLCRNIFSSADLLVKHESVSVEKHVPTVIRTHGKSRPSGTTFTNLQAIKSSLCEN